MVLKATADTLSACSNGWPGAPFHMVLVWFTRPPTGSGGPCICFNRPWKPGIQTCPEVVETAHPAKPRACGIDALQMLSNVLLATCGTESANASCISAGVECCPHRVFENCWSHSVLVAEHSSGNRARQGSSLVQPDSHLWWPGQFCPPPPPPLPPQGPPPPGPSSKDMHSPCYPLAVAKAFEFTHTQAHLHEPQTLPCSDLAVEPGIHRPDRPSYNACSRPLRNQVKTIQKRHVLKHACLPAPLSCCCLMKDGPA